VTTTQSNGEMTVPEIFKIQVPLGGNVADPPALVYNRSRSREFQLTVTKELLDLMAGEPKKYFRGVFKRGEFSIIEEVHPWQDW
jgi:hypothetical protein